MKNVLRVTTSLFENDSVSSLLMEELLAKFQAGGENFHIVERNFRENPVPHLDADWLQALSTPAVDRSEEQQAKVSYSDSLVAEIQAADTLVIALPMYNFSVPSMLKAWIDHIARAGVTFKYTATGAEGLLQDKQVYLVSAMGGVHEQGDTREKGQTDFLRPYVELIMGFIGLNDVEFITAAGLNMGDRQREQGLAEARAEIENLVSQRNIEQNIPQEEAA